MLGYPLFRDDLRGVPVAKFIGPVVGLVEQIQRDRLAGEIGQVNSDVSPLHVLAFAFYYGLVANLTVDVDRELPVSLSMGSNTESHGDFRCRRQSC